MRSNSPLFDRIRVKPDQDRSRRAELPSCQWPDCKAPATHRAPKGRLRATEYWQFCLAHVREYNSTYNFFAGMSDDAIAQYQKIADRSSPDLEDGLDRREACATAARMTPRRRVDGRPVLAVRRSGPRRAGKARSRPETRKVFNAQRRALDVLGLEADAQRADIKAGSRPW